MRNRSLGWLLLGAWIGVWPLAANASYLSDARDALKKGDLRSAQIDLRNAVKQDPQNGEAHYWLGRVSLELGDPVAAEREAALPTTGASILASPIGCLDRRCLHRTSLTRCCNR